MSDSGRMPDLAVAILVLATSGISSIASRFVSSPRDDYYHSELRRLAIVDRGLASLIDNTSDESGSPPSHNCGWH